MVTKFVLDDPDTLIRIGYQPGFSHDLTSWKTQIIESGELTQVIRWHTDPFLGVDSDNPYFHNRPEKDVRFAQLSEKQIEQVRKTIDALDLDGLQQLQENYVGWIDDAEEVSITIPSKELHIELSAYSLETEFLGEDLDWSETERSCLRSIILLEGIVNSFAPFSAEKHFYELEVQREKDLADAKRRRLNPTWFEIIENNIFRWIWRFCVFMILFVVPASGMYEIGETLWYQKYYLKDTGLIAGCTNQQTESGEIYHVVVKTREAWGITDRRYDNGEDCTSQIGRLVFVLINPENREEIVMDSFRERWLPALKLFIVSGLFIFIYRAMKYAEMI